MPAVKRPTTEWPRVIPMPWRAYERLEVEGHSEYIDGCLVVHPTPALRHQLVILNLATRLGVASADGYTAVG